VSTSSVLRRRRIHPAWAVAAVTFVTMLGAAGFRSVPGVELDPLHDQFGWSHGTIGAAMSVNMTLFGLTSPFAAALMDRFGIRPVVTVALGLVAAGSGLTVFMTQAWQLILLWGVLVGLGTGSMSMALVATVTTRWFVARRGLVSGVLTAANATGQLIFLPVVARLTAHHGWKTASLVVAVCALSVVPLVLLFMRNHPHDTGRQALGATELDPGPPPSQRVGNSAVAALSALRTASRSWVFWLLAGSFAICGASTNGLIGTHFIPAAHDHGMPATTAAGLLALVGVFDVGLAVTFMDRWQQARGQPSVRRAHCCKNRSGSENGGRHHGHFSSRSARLSADPSASGVEAARWRARGGLDHCQYRELAADPADAAHGAATTNGPADAAGRAELGLARIRYAGGFLALSSGAVVPRIESHVRAKRQLL